MPPAGAPSDSWLGQSELLHFTHHADPEGVESKDVEAAVKAPR
jgi:hypothetical protein